MKSHILIILLSLFITTHSDAMLQRALFSRKIFSTQKHRFNKQQKQRRQYHNNNSSKKTKQIKKKSKKTFWIKVFGITGGMSLLYAWWDREYNHFTTSIRYKGKGDELEQRYQFILKKNKTEVGYCTVEVNETNKQAYIYSITVFEPYQNRGLGTQLLENVLSSLESDEYKSVTLKVLPEKERLINWYKRYGFEEVPSNYNAFKKMKKSFSTKN